MGLPWIQVAKEFPRSQEAIELAAELKLPRPHAVGLAVEFWCWAADAAPDGVVRGAETARAVSVVDIAAGHIGFGDAAIRVGLLEPCDGGVRICGWLSRYGQALEKASKDAERKRAARKRRADGAGMSADCPRDVPRTGAGKSQMKSQMKREEETTLSTLSTADEVFAHWQSVMGHPAAKFDRKRRRVVHDALKAGYTLEQLKSAIDGCAKTPHNMGQNDRGERYDGLALILRDAEHIDRFLRNARDPPGGLAPAPRNGPEAVDRHEPIEKPEHCAYWAPGEPECQSPPTKAFGGRQWMCAAHYATAFERLPPAERVNLPMWP